MGGQEPPRSLAVNLCLRTCCVQASQTGDEACAKAGIAKVADQLKTN